MKSITKKKINDYLTLSQTEEIDILTLANWLAIQSEGSISISKKLSKKRSRYPF